MTLASEIPAEFADNTSPPTSRRGLVIPISVYSGLTVVIIIAIWALSAHLQLVSPVFLPSPVLVAQSAWSRPGSRARARSMGARLERLREAVVGEVGAIGDRSQAAA